MAIHHQIEQRSREWKLIRLGRPSASEFHRIVTPKGKLSKQAAGYAHTLLAEMMLGRPLGDDIGTAFMDRGSELEESAIKAYEFAEDVETQDGGYVTNDVATYGCSPDRLVGEDGLVEMKVPAASTHMGYLLSREIDEEKRPQVQGQLLVTGRQWVDLVSYHPEMPLVVVRVERDEEYIDALRQALDEFAANLAEARRLLEERYGKFPEPPVAEEAIDDAALGVSDADVDAMLRHGLVIPEAEEVF